MDYSAMAQTALSIFWGGALCGLGYLALYGWLSIATESRDGTEESAATAMICTVAFAAALLFTLSLADVFHVWDWLHHR